MQVIFIGDIQKCTNDAALNLQIIKKMGLLSEEPLHNILNCADVIVDAIFGTGLRGSLSGEAALAVKAINDCPASVVAVDIPSGVEADTGKVSGTAVRADITVTFGLAKLGHMLYPGTEYAGRVIVEDISIPQNILQGPYLEVLEDISGLLPPRPARSNKGTYGRVCVLAGSKDMPGAAALCCKAAYRAGAGLVHACVVPEVARIIQISAHEVITSCALDPLNVKDAIDKADVIAIGPGMGRSPDVFAFVQEVLTVSTKPMIIDADALMAIAADKSVLQKIKVPCILTPHPGEMAALTGTTIPQVLEDIVKCARDFARNYGVVTVLKDARTVIAAPNGQTFINPTGTPALAKAGSGDVLTGIIAAFMAQGCKNAPAAAAIGAYVHGKAGQLASENMSLYGVVAEDVAEYAGRVINTMSASL